MICISIAGWWYNGVRDTGKLLNATDCLSVVANRVHPFMNKVCPSSTDYFQQDNVPYHKAMNSL